ncbi:ATP-binding protein [Marinospirillum sp.]|uniref:ATP-binding protein n=1 Tax=Marinospirillum sp. TaxID=2183934 RepID=UPI00385085D6
MKSASIRARTLGWVLLLFISVSGIIAWSSFHDATHEVEELYDAHLAQQARLIDSLLVGMDATSMSQVAKLRLLNTMEQTTLQTPDTGKSGHQYESKVVFQVWKDEQLVLRSRSAPSGQLTQKLQGYVNERVDQHIWRVFVLNQPSNAYRILMAERDDVRGELVSKIALRTLLPDLLGIPLLALLIWWAIGRGFQPLNQLAELLRKRDPRSLQPLALSPLPKELDTIQEAVNLLMLQLKELLAREQRFIADAAHELRTPLSVLSLHTQNALQAANPKEQQESLQELQQGIERTTRIVSQLLTLARLEPDTKQQRVKVNPLKVTRDVLAELAPLAWQDKVELQLLNEEDTPWELQLEPGSLEILLQNLVTNALRHTPKGRRIAVHWQVTQEDSLQVAVIDQGCGVSDQEKPLLLQRFYRKGSYTGSGLGLAIVARLVERHQARLTLDDTPGGGLTVRITWPMGGHSQRVASC